MRYRVNTDNDDVCKWYIVFDNYTLREVSRPYFSEYMAITECDRLNKEE